MLAQVGGHVLAGCTAQAFVDARDSIAAKGRSVAALDHQRGQSVAFQRQAPCHPYGAVTLFGAGQNFGQPAIEAAVQMRDAVAQAGDHLVAAHREQGQRPAPLGVVHRVLGEEPLQAGPVVGDQDLLESDRVLHEALGVGHDDLPGRRPRRCNGAAA